MVKEGDLWDDSALVNAFENAMTKYMKMHKKKKKDKSSAEGVNVRSGTEENATIVTDEIDGATRGAEKNPKVDPRPEIKTDEIKNLPPSVEPYVGSSTGEAVQDNQDALKGSLDLQGAEDYNQLLSQYYKVEEKRQTILQQLQQFGNWNCQYSGEVNSALGTQEAGYLTSQEYPMPPSQTCHQNLVCCCCPYVGQYLAAPCTSYPTCSLGGTCTIDSCNGKATSAVDDGIVKTAMGAAEKAISSLRIDSYTNINTSGENVEGKENEQEMASSTGSGTDLSMVLNAWYSAGFYTGKYLTEQSLSKQKHS